MSNRLKSILFAAILCFVCSAILTTASTGLQRFQQQNMRIDRHRNILRSVGLVESDRRYAADEIESMGTSFATMVERDGFGLGSTSLARLQTDLIGSAPSPSARPASALGVTAPGSATSRAARSCTRSVRRGWQVPSARPRRWWVATRSDRNSSRNVHWWISCLHR